jgi:Glycolipid transfer protein (GLTP)
MGFEFEKMVTAFEAVLFVDAPDSSDPRLPLAAPFLDAMCEVALLFDHLGGGFAFVRRDIASKVALLRAHAPADDDLTAAVTAEFTVGSRRPQKNDPPTATRTLLRLMWATQFIDVLLRELAAAFAAESGSDVSSEVSEGGLLARRGAELRIGTLREAVAAAYEESLAPHHSWGIKRTVNAACYLLPSKEVFVEKLGVDLSKRNEYFRRIDASLTPMVAQMYAFYALHNLHES